MAARVKLAAHIGYLFTELPLVDRFAAARDAGFAAVDLSDIVRFPLADILTGMRRSGLPLLQTTAAVGARDQNGPGMTALPGREAEFRASCEAVLPAIEATGIRFVHLLAGRPAGDMPLERCYQTYVDNLRWAVELFTRRGVVVLIEPINPTDIPGYFLGSLVLARRAIAEIADANLRLLFDVYHLAMMGLEPVAAFRESHRDIGHVQLADCPGRHEPGTGTIDFAALTAAAAAVVAAAAIDTAYECWFSAEYLPAGETAAGLGWVRSFTTGSAVAADPRV